MKTKYLTFTIEADNLKTARARLTRIGLDLLGYFKTMGCVAHVMDGQERLEVLHGIFHRTANRSALTGTGWHPPACLPRILWPRPPSVSVRPKPLV